MQVRSDDLMSTRLICFPEVSESRKAVSRVRNPFTQGVHGIQNFRRPWRSFDGPVLTATALMGPLPTSAEHSAAQKEAY